MAITRTAKGTAQSKAATTSLTIAGVSINAGETLVVGIGYETDAALNSVQFGSKEMQLVAASGATQGDTRVRIYKTKVKNTKTRDIVATWAANMSARVMFATAVSEASQKDVGSTNTHGAGTTAPTTGTAVTSTVADTISIAAFVSAGPSGDTPGTAGAGHTLGQRVGTTGGGAATNVTIQETFEILAATGNVRATLSGATGRAWATSIVALNARNTYTVVDSFRNLRVTDTDADAVLIEIDPGAEANFFVRIDMPVFEVLTDQEVADVINAGCVWHADHILDGDNAADPTPSAEQTRMDNLVNDTFTV